MPSEEERKRLKEDGFTLMISHVSSKPNESYELWLLSPALNADGTPMLKDQLKEMMQEKE